MGVELDHLNAGSESYFLCMGQVVSNERVHGLTDSSDKHESSNFKHRFFLSMNWNLFPLNFIKCLR